MKKNSSKTNKEKKAVVEEKETQGKFTLNKKIIILICLVLIIIVITTLAIGILNKKQNTATLEAKKTEFNIQDNEHMHVELDASGDKVPVPNGYVGSKVTGENEIHTGYVIYEGEEEVNDTNKEEAQRSRKQYVWIPVPEPSKMYGTDAHGKKWGKLYEFTSGTNSSALFDEVTGTYPRNWSENNRIMNIYNKRDWREPDIVPTYENLIYDADSELETLGIKGKTAHEFLIQLEKEFNNMIASVEKYRGFYIGRYETGDLKKETVVVQKGNTDIANQTWYSMYKKCKNLKENNTNIETGMVWGSQYDRTLMWLIETGSKTKKQIAEDSSSWGNYKDATFEYINSSGNTVIKNEGKYQKIPTGSTEYTNANNIYDLAGNVSDWCMDAYWTFSRNNRGGYYYLTAEWSSASGQQNTTVTYSSDNLGCRAMLYIK